MAYEEFAEVYDLFNEDADYDALFAYLQARLLENGVQDGIVADLGCGTGELTLRLAQAGYDMIGVDLSADMLSVLREKAAEAELQDVLLLQQDLTQLDLYGTIRAVVSTFDTFNHLAPEQLETAICRASLFLEMGGVFLFDMNTPYKHEIILADNTFELEADDALCIWKNHYDAQNKRTQIEIDLNYADGEAYVEKFCEYSYSRVQIEAMCAKAGLRILSVCDGEQFAALTPHSQRFLFTAIKES
ncbi:MAG: class I SAM-dependent methyltransferase [Ruthenibacterium sp.]